MKANLENILKGKVVVVGIGNILRDDDAAGPKVIERLKGKTRAVCIDAGASPENFIGKIAKEGPDTVLLIDAVHMGLEPGGYAVIKKDDIANHGLTTHDISPERFISFLENQTRADIYLLAIQPKTVDFGDKISDEVNEAVLRVSELIREALNA